MGDKSYLWKACGIGGASAHYPCHLCPMHRSLRAGSQPGGCSTCAQGPDECHFHWDIATKPVLAAQRARYDDLRRRLAPNQGDFMWRSADDLKKKCRIAGWLPKETRYRQAMEALSEWLNERGAAVRYACRFIALVGTI